jgi:undecaprenyl-diphosphatase
MYAAGLIAKDPELKNNALKTGISLVGTTAITYALKSSLGRQRPYINHPDKIFSSADATGYSFPSGHTSTAFSLATSLSLSYPKWYVIVPSYTFAAATAYSRMYKGVHYPSDVLGGMIVGAGTSFLTWKIDKLLHKKFYHRQQHR